MNAIEEHEIFETPTPIAERLRYLQSIGRGTRDLRDKDGLKLFNIPDYVIEDANKPDCANPDASPWSGSETFCDFVARRREEREAPRYDISDYKDGETMFYVVSGHTEVPFIKANGRAAQHSLNDGFRDIRPANIWAKRDRAVKRAYHAALDWFDYYRPVVGGMAALALTGAMVWAIVNIGGGLVP